MLRSVGLTYLRLDGHLLCCAESKVLIPPLLPHTQNWHNEIKRFTPGLSAIKVHGSQKERDRILTMDAVLRGEYDVYLTTYETIVRSRA